MGDGLNWLRPVGLNGIKKRNLMSLWKGLMSLCMVWLNCSFAILFFVFCLTVLLGCVPENVCCCICFYSWGLCSPCISLSPYSTCKDVFFKYSIFVLTPSSLPFLFPSVLRIGRGQCFAKAVIHASKRVKPTTTDPRNFQHQLPALKAPYLLPTLQEIEVSDTSQMIESIGSCTGPRKWLEYRRSIGFIQLYWIHP